MQKRLLSLVLCLITVFTTVSIGLTNMPVSAASPIVSVLYEGEAIESISVPESDKRAVEAGCDCNGEYSIQWQILADINEDLWVDIHGQTNKILELSKALVDNVSENSSAYIRASVKADESKFYSAPVCVTIEQAVSFASPSSQKEAPARMMMSLSDEEPVPEAVDDGNVYVIINYLDAKDLTPIWARYSSQLKNDDGFEFRQNVLSPSWLGFTAFYCYDNPSTMNPDDATTPAKEIDIYLDNSHDEDVVYNVFYKPAMVPFGAKFMYQNIYDDFYTEDTDKYVSGTAETGTYVEDSKFNEWGDMPGFSALYHFPETVAADGSTVFECYYDRNYYLLKFDMNGGYGTEPIYAKYETPFFVNTPQRAGYRFVGWDLCDEDYPTGNGKPDTVPETVPAGERAYIAIWEKVQSSYTIVYWAENPNDDNYSFWGYRKVNNVYSEDVAKVNSDPNGAEMIDPTEIKYFTYNPEMSDKAVVVKGDGSTIANVYFTRNEYTVVFYDRLGTGDYLCGYDTNHTHTQDCYEITCGIEEHSHSESGCQISCGFEEHTHNASCPTNNCTHKTHDLTCYTMQNPPAATNQTGFTNIKQKYPNPISGNVYRYASKKNSNAGNTYNFFYFEGSWYYLGTGNGASATIGGVSFQGMPATNNAGDMATAAATIKCSHIHTAQCYSCGYQEHTHSDSCYDCGQAAHTHTAECSTLTCGEHVHNQNCKYGSLACDGNGVSTSQGTVNDARVLHTIKAKYQADISDKWPDETKIVDNNGKHVDFWSIYPPEWGGKKQLTKIPTMTPELCNESSGGRVTYRTSILFARYVPVNTTAKEWGVSYYFESVDQTSPANGTTRFYHNGYKKYYDIDPEYTQTVYGTNSLWGLKKIDGMDILADTAQNPNPYYYDENNNRITNPENYNKAYAQFFYDRKYYEVSLINYDSNVPGYPIKRMYGASIKDLKDIVPPYPETLEKNAFYFDGWYTTPKCIDGSECDFENQTVPIDGIALYAKWAPKTHDVKFFLSEDIMNAYYAGEQIDGEDAEIYQEFSSVVHGNSVGSVTHPSDRGDVVFKGWFYYNKGVKKQIIPENHLVIDDMDVFAEWGSKIAQPYLVHYVLLEDKDIDPSKLTDEERRNLTPVADDTIGYAYQGATKTFNAKAGDPYFQLYEQYNSGCFPTYASTSIVMRSVEDKSNPVENEVWFYYVQHVPVPYIVRYIDAATGKELLPDKVYEDNKHGVITERFVPIENYIPDQIYKRLILQYDPNHDYTQKDGYDENDPQENVVTFYYTKNGDLRPYAVHHMFQKPGTNQEDYNIYGTEGILEPGAYFEYTKSEGTSDLEYIDINPISVRGYDVIDNYSKLFNTIEPDVTQKESNIPMTDGHFSIRLSTNGKGYGTELYIYYRLEKYPYIVKYLEYGTETEVHPTKEDKEKVYEYNSTVTERYVDLEKKGYTLIGEPVKQLTIKDNPAQNEIIFYYTKQSFTVQYQPWYKGGGIVSPEGETITTGQSFKGSVPTPNYGYEFDGWYLDKECQTPVDSSWVDSDNRIVPDVNAIDRVNGKNNIYYAKFKPLFASLIIDRSNADNEGNGDQMFVYKVTNVETGEVITVTVKGNGRTTISELNAGEYTVEQENGWSWRFSDGKKPVTVTTDGNATVKFDGDAIPYWLNGNSKPVKNVKSRGAE